MVVVPKGTPVIYYPTGEKTGDGISAYVDSSNAHGMCDVNVFNRGNLSFRTSVWHCDADQLKKIPTLRAKFGAWDFNPWFVPPLVKK